MSFTQRRLFQIASRSVFGQTPSQTPDVGRLKFPNRSDLTHLMGGKWGEKDETSGRESCSGVFFRTQ